MSDSEGCKEHLESLFEKYLGGDDASAKEFAAYVRYFILLFGLIIFINPSSGGRNKY